ncbi:hypothetical protein C2G38_2048780 [Gigaspora rosea]|uniref:Uncharacterized protein n=1 Tax=Gigaspora rosea TaxID=44941 RepID=A0A397U1F6_9GLOM|nr:hypothetical protein C2G38_2048780 [Gigaspora rosea]
MVGMGTDLITVVVPGVVANSWSPYLVLKSTLRCTCGFLPFQVARLSLQSLGLESCYSGGAGLDFSSWEVLPWVFDVGEIFVGILMWVLALEVALGWSRSTSLVWGLVRSEKVLSCGPFHRGYQIRGSVGTCLVLWDLGIESFVVGIVNTIKVGFGIKKKIELMVETGDWGPSLYHIGYRRIIPKPVIQKEESMNNFKEVRKVLICLNKKFSY